MHDENKNIAELIAGLRESLERLNKKVDAQNEKIRALENGIATMENKGVLKEAAPPPPPPPPKLDAATQAEKSKIEGALSNALHMNSYVEDGTGNAPALKGEEEEMEENKEDRGTLEEVIGGRWFAKIGIVVTVLGISFFLKYAFDNDWIGETGRVILGLMAGLGLLALGEKTIRKYFLYGQIVSGGGLAIIYLSIFASYNFYHLVSQPLAFLFMGLATLAGIALSLRYNASSLMIFSTLGGFAAPFLVNSGVNNQLGLFAYVAILDLAVLAVSYFKRWRWLNLIGFLGTIMLFSSWHGAYYSPDQLFSTFAFATIFFLIYSLSSLIYNLVNKESSTGFEQVMTLVAGLIYFAYSYSILNSGYHALMGFFALLLAVYYFLWAYSVKAVTPNDANLYNFLAFLSVGFITIAIPLQFSKFIITIAWLVEAALLLYAGSRQPGKNGDIIKIFGSLVMALALLRLAFEDPAYYKQTDLMFFNKVFLVSLIAIAVQYICAYAFHSALPEKEDQRSMFDPKTALTVFLVLASLLTVFTVTREIVTYNYNQIKIANAEVREYNAGIKKEYGNHQDYLRSVDSEQIKRIEERSSATVSVFWVIYAIFILSVGMTRKKKRLMVFGTTLCLLVVIKLFVYELWEMDTLYRPMISATAIFGSYFVAIIYYLYHRTGSECAFMKPFKVFTLFIVIANVLTIFAVSRDLYIYHENLVDEYRQRATEVCQAPYSKFSTGRVQTDTEACRQITADIKSLHNRASIYISLFWLFYAIVLIAIGFIKRYKWVRIGGISLLGVAIFKLFFMDLWSLGQLYRIIASISLGLVLLIISFVYQKYRHLFKEIIKD